MLSGKQTLGSIDRALGELRREESSINARLERATQALGEIRAKELDAFRELAAFRLSDSAKAALEGRLEEVGREVRQILEERTSKIAALGNARTELESKLQDLFALRARMSAEREKAADHLDEIMEKIEDRLAEDPAFIAQEQRAETSRKMAEAARAKARQAEEDRDRKGIAYESDPLFLYLWNRGFGTPAYSSGGIIRLLDRWVARLIRYHDARPNYSMLTEIPIRLDAHATDLEDRAHEEMQTVAEITRTAVVETAGEDLAGRISDLDAKIAENTSLLETEEKKLSEIAAEENKFLRAEDEGFQDAAKRLAVSLRSEDLRKLWQESVATPSLDDEKIVRRLQDLAEEIQQIESDIKHNNSLRRDIESRREELSKVAREFRRSGYDDWNTTFSNDGLATVILGELIKGAITAADYWAHAQKSRGRRESRGRGIGFPGGFGLPGSMGGTVPSGRSSSLPRGSDWGGGFSTGGKFGGGGFKTGKTF